MDIEKKIRKLLALSESPNEFEAQAALLKARKLMAEYKLTEAELHEGNKKVKTIKTSISCTKRTNFWIFTLSTVIGENYCCQAVHERAKHSKTYFIGWIRWTRRRCEYMCKYFYICSGLRFNTDTKFETYIL